MIDNTDITSVGDRFDHVDWRQSAIAGVAAWVIGLLLTVAVVVVSSVGDIGHLRDESTLDLSVWLYYESIGGAFELDRPLVASQGSELGSFGLYQYELLDSNVWGTAVFVHYLIPAVVVTIAGYVLAGRYARGEIDGTATPTPVQVVVGGASLTAGFAAATILAMLVVGGEMSYGVGQLLFVSVLYPLVFASFGAGIRSRVRTVIAPWGLVGGIAAASLGAALWYAVDDPLEPFSFSDLEGLTEHLGFLYDYLSHAHAFGYENTLPEWYVVLALTAIGAAIVYRSGTTDWLVGLGRGARLGVGYVIVTSVVAFGFFGSSMNELLDNSGLDRGELIDIANATFGASAPRVIVLAGILWAVVFGAVGGAIGAKIVAARRDVEQSDPVPSSGDAAE